MPSYDYDKARKIFYKQTSKTSTGRKLASGVREIEYKRKKSKRKVITRKEEPEEIEEEPIEEEEQDIEREIETVDHRVGQFYTIPAYQQFWSTRYHKAVETYQGIDPYGHYHYKGGILPGNVIRAELQRDYIEPTRKAYDESLKLGDDVSIFRGHTGFSIYESKSEPGISLGGFGSYVLGIGDYAWSSLTGDTWSPGKPVESKTMRETRIRAYHRDVVAWEKADILHFGIKILSNPYTTAFIGGGFGYGSTALGSSKWGSKAFLGSYVSRGTAVKSFIGGASAGYITGMGSKIYQEQGITGVRDYFGKMVLHAPGVIGGYQIGQSYALSRYGYPMGTGISFKPKWEMKHFKITGRPETITAQKYATVFGRRFHYGSKLTGVKPGFYKPGTPNYTGISQVTTKYMDIPRSNIKTSMVASSSKPSVEGVLFSVPYKLNVSGLTGGDKIYTGGGSLGQLSGGYKTNIPRVYDSGISWSSIETQLPSTIDTKIPWYQEKPWYAPSKQKTHLKPVEELYPSYEDFGKTLQPEKQVSTTVKRTLAVDTKPEADVWKWTDTFAKQRTSFLTLTKPETLTDVWKWTDIYAKPKTAVATSTKTRTSLFHMFAISTAPSVKTKTRTDTKTLTMPQIKTQTLTIPQIKTQTSTMPQIKTMPLTKPQTLTKPQFDIPVISPTQIITKIRPSILFFDDEPKRRKKKKKHDPFALGYKFRLFEPTKFNYKSPFASKKRSKKKKKAKLPF